jgi:hypothetical protein
MKSPPLSFSVDSEYVINGIQMVVHSFDEQTGQVRLRNPLSDAKVDFSASELALMRMNGRLSVAADTQVKHTPTRQPTLRRLSRDQSLCVARRAAYARASVHLYPVGPLSARLRTAIDEVAARINDSRPPSSHSVYRWVRRLVLSNYDTGVFLQDAGAIRQRKPRIELKAQELLRQQIEDLLGRTKHATLNGVMNEALAHVAKELGYHTFISKEGDEHAVEEFLARLPQRPVKPTSKGFSRGV